MASLNETLLDLCSPENQPIVTGLLISSGKDVRIAVPCAVLSKGASGTGSKVVVTVTRAHGSNVKLECGAWCRGAPTTSVYMDYRQLLQHANNDALRALHRKLVVAISNSRSKGLGRTQSVPGRILLEELANSSSGGTGSGPASSHGGSKLQRTSSGGMPPACTSGRLHRTNSIGLPPSGASALQRVGSLPSASSSGSSRAGSSHLRPAHTLRRLSTAAAQQRPGSAGAGLPAGAAGELITQQKQLLVPAAGQGVAAERTPDQLLVPFTPCYEDSAAEAQMAHGGTRLSFDSPDDGEQHPQPLAESSADFSMGSGAYELGSPTGVASAAAAGSRAPSRQLSFSRPYFATFGEELELLHRQQQQRQQQQQTTPRVVPAAGLSDEDSGSMRAEQLVAGEQNMTIDELHEVNPSFHHVFVPPWAVPAAPQQQVVRTFREAGMQTSTGNANERPLTRDTHTAADAAEHFQAFMQHFAASMPHLAMALADMHLGRGGEDPTFVKSQYYFNSLLQLKDEMFQLGERLQTSDSCRST